MSGRGWVRLAVAHRVAIAAGVLFYVTGAGEVAAVVTGAAVVAVVVAYLVRAARGRRVSFWTVYWAVLACVAIAGFANLAVVVVYYMRGGRDWPPALTGAFGVIGSAIITAYGVEVGRWLRRAQKRAGPTPADGAGRKGESARDSATHRF